MTVRQLRDILDTLPDKLVVFSRDGLECTDVIVHTTKSFNPAFAKEAPETCVKLYFYP